MPSVASSIDAIISEIILNHINPWFLHWEKSNSNTFQNELQMLLDTVFVNLGIGLKSMDKCLFIASITQRIKSHLIYYRDIEGSVVDVEEILFEKYFRLSWKLLGFTLPKREIESRVLFTFLNEIVGGTILPLIVGKISKPHFLNTIIVYALSDSDHKIQEKNKDLLLSDILDQGQGLIEFIQFLKEQKSYSMVQFYYAVDSFKKIFKFMKSVKDLGKHALEIYNIFFSLDSNPNTRIYLHGNGKLLKKTLLNIQRNPNSNVFDPVLKCILRLLEDRYLLVFKKSKYYKDYLKENSSNTQYLRRKAGFRNLEIEDQTRHSYLLHKLDLQIKGKLELVSLKDDLRFLELKIKEETDEAILLELQTEKNKIVDRIQNMELKPSLDSLHSIDQKEVEPLENMNGRSFCTKSFTKAFSCVGESLQRSLRISKPPARCKSQDPFTKKRYQDYSSFKSSHEPKSFEESLSEETIISSVISHRRAKSASIFESLIEMQDIKEDIPRTPKDDKMKLKEMNFVLDCTCEVIEEIFHLSAPTNWLRSQSLNLVKTVLRSAYGSAMSEIIQNYVSDLLNEDTICVYLDTIREYVWPNDNFIEPNLEEKEITKSKAWDLLIEQANPHETKLGIGIYRIQSIVGRYNTIIGLTRLFNMLQHEELNRLLAFSFLEALIDISCIQ